MLTVISPAKKLNERPHALPDGMDVTEPAFAADALRLARIAKKLSVADLQKLMGISENLARLNHGRFADFAANPGHGTHFAAIHCFAGDTYQGLDAATLSDAGALWAEGHLRILSGLYGLLRPFDAIQPYRLEMGSRLSNPKGADLYSYWGSKIAKALNTLGNERGVTSLLNCASVEYVSAVDRKTLRLQLITPTFLEERDGQARIVSFWAKRARGAMARFVCENALTDPKDLRGFDLGGYAFRPDLSQDDRPVFTRREQALAAA